MPTHESTPDVLVSEVTDADMHELVEMSVAELPDRIAVIEKAVGEQGITVLGTLAQQLKESAGGYGFPSITETAKLIESNAKTGEDLETLAEQTRALADLCSRARAIVPTT